MFLRLFSILICFNILQTVKQVDELEEQEKDRVMAEVLFKEESKENICFK